MPFIPVNSPDIGKLEKKKIIECIDSGWISSEGPFVNEFESKFAQIVDREFGIAVSSGTAALDIAVKALNISEGDEVILPSFSIISCVAAIVKAGAKPVLIDSKLDTWNMDISKIEEKINKKTKAIMVVHTYGLPVEMDEVLELTKKYNLFLIEDAAEMHGQTYKNKKCGSFGDISTFSFYPNKHITTGEGGMLVCDSEKIADRCRSLRNLCFQKNKRFVHEELGWNYRITSLQAALGIAQINKLEKNVIKKRKIGNLYRKYLENNKNVILPIKKTNYARNIYWVFGLILKKNSLKDISFIMESLKKSGIGTRPFFWPVHLQPVFKKKGWFKNEVYPNSEYMANNGFYLPSGLSLKEIEIEYICEKLNTILQDISK